MKTNKWKVVCIVEWISFQTRNWGAGNTRVGQAESDGVSKLIQVTRPFIGCNVILSMAVHWFGNLFLKWLKNWYNKNRIFKYKYYIYFCIIGTIDINRKKKVHYDFSKRY